MLKEPYNVYIIGDSHVEKWQQAKRLKCYDGFFKIIGKNAHPGKTAQGLFKNNNHKKILGDIGERNDILIDPEKKSDQRTV